MTSLIVNTRIEYNVQQAAELLGKDGSTIRRWVERGYFGKTRRDGFGPTSAIMIDGNAVKEVAKRLELDIEEVMNEQAVSLDTAVEP